MCNNKSDIMENPDLLLRQYESNMIYLAQTGHISHSFIDNLEKEYQYCKIENEKYFEKLRSEVNKFRESLKVKA